MKYEFNGISTNFEPNENEFFEIYDRVWITKTPFTVELDDKVVNLHLFIEDIDMAEYDTVCTDHIIDMGVIPAFKSLSEKNQKNILDQYSDDERDNLKSDTSWLLYDILTYGFRLTLRSVTVTNIDELDHTIKSAMATYRGVTGLIGFELDRPLNAIGNSGWDFLNDYCCDKDLLKSALEKVE